MEWTAAAKDELDRHMESARSGLEGSGADPAEVVEDLRRHVQEEALISKLSVVTDHDVRRILARLGPVTPATAIEHPPVSNLLGSVALGSASLAVLAILVEVFTHTCAGMFFDPIPTRWHLLLVTLVPAGTVYSIFAARRPGQPGARLQTLASFCLGIALYYSLQFLPILPVAAIGVVFFGIGLLPMAPMFSAAGAFAAYSALTKRAPDVGRRRLLLGLGSALAVFIAIEAPQTLTRTGLAWSAGNDAAKARRGVGLLRRFGNEEILRRACYMRAGRATDLMTMFVAGPPVAPEKARLVYYSVYGVAFNSLPPPKGVSRRDDDWGSNWDSEQGGEIVGNRVSKLALSSSRLDGSIDAAAALGYLEWIMVFKNDSVLAQEARALVALPPGGVVSRLTLWIDGEEREAAFGGRGQVKQAYEAVVRQQRDPVLVTTRGPDRVMVQLFPVPPNGGEMKVRLGITAPIVPLAPDRWALQLPSIGERNFGLAGLSHAVWMESKNTLTSATLKAEAATGGSSALRGAVSDEELSAGYAIRLLEPPSDFATGSDPLGGAVRQTLRKIVATTPVVLVVDGSGPMAMSLPGIAAALRDNPVEAVFVAADEELLEWTGNEAASKLTALSARGGQDNVPALVRAWDVAAAKRGAVIWIHGPVPVALTTIEALRQRWERRPSGPVVHEMIVGGGANAVAAGLDGLSGITQVPRTGALEDDLRLLLDRFSGRRPAVAMLRERGAGSGARTSTHLARLWALDEIRRLLTAGKPEQISKAVELSIGHRLVTPVSGAVVLETAQQYKSAGLDVPESTKGPAVPVIPEPETWALLILSAMAFLWWTRKKIALA
ncbi:MAG: VIT domain-containing protein [Elusimicrobiota bacterium]|nr:VIT domain-containing protein [Elusimicrobiota bacterium]